MRTRLRSGPRLFCPLQTTNKRVKSDACEQPGRTARRGTEARSARAGWVEEGGGGGERERMVNARDPICTLLQQTHLSIVVSNRTGGGTGGTLTHLRGLCVRACVCIHTYLDANTFHRQRREMHPHTYTDKKIQSLCQEWLYS